MVEISTLLGFNDANFYCVAQKGFRNGLQSSRIFVIGRDNIDRMGDRAKRGLIS